MSHIKRDWCFCFQNNQKTVFKKCAKKTVFRVFLIQKSVFHIMFR